MSTRISVIIATLNEEKNIARCLKSVAFASEVLVLDSGSTDNTVQIAQAHGAQVHHQPWLGFGAQKNKATDLCSNDWILSLDADEALDDEAVAFMTDFMKDSAHGAEAYRFSRLSFYLNRWIRHGGWFPDYKTRLYDRRYFRWSEDPVHEMLLGSKAIGTAHGMLLHWVFRDLFHQVETNNRYSTLGAEALLKRGQKFRLHKLFTKPLSKFLETYVFKRGFMDGLAGFIISVGAAYSVFLKFSKLWELQRVKGRPIPSKEG